MKAEEALRNCRVLISKGNFAVFKSKETYPHAFANIVDENEITVIIDEMKYSKKDVIKVKKGWKILTFDAVLPFELVGFLAVRLLLRRISAYL